MSSVILRDVYKDAVTFVTLIKKKRKQKMSLWKKDKKEGKEIKNLTFYMFRAIKYVQHENTVVTTFHFPDIREMSAFAHFRITCSLFLLFPFLSF